MKRSAKKWLRAGVLAAGFLCAIAVTVSAKGFLTEEYAKNLGMQKVKSNDFVYYIDAQSMGVYRNMGNADGVFFIMYRFAGNYVYRYEMLATLDKTGEEGLRELATQTLDTNGNLAAKNTRSNFTYDLQTDAAARALFDYAVKMLRDE